MKKASPSLVILFLGIISFFLFGYKKPSSTFDPHRVGDVVYSILSPENFRKEHGDGWVLMDGGTIPVGSRIQKDYSLNKSPNALGRFVRTMNYNGAGTDPDTRIAGDTQEDAFQGHFHQFGDNIVIVNDGSNGDNYITISRPRTGVNTLAPEQYLKNRNYIKEPKNDNKNGNPRTANETRPKNISLYIYLKVND